MRDYRYVKVPRAAGVKWPWDEEWTPIPSWELERDRVPRIPEDYLDVVAFLYPSRAAAEEGRRGGATGFLVTHPGDGASLSTHYYVVTCKHCLCDGLTIRMTRRSPTDTRATGLEFKETIADDWIKHPNGYDVAVYHIKDKWFSDKNISALGAGTVSPFWMFALQNIGPGHEIYLGTRFQGLDHPRVNLPILQSGIVASMPLNPVKDFVNEPFILIETHSRLGYSGAPVFAYLTEEDRDLLPPSPGERIIQLQRPILFPLGVFSRHIWSYEEVLDKASREKGRPLPDHWAPTPSALGAVIPAWEILEILQGDEAMKQRKQAEEAWAEEADKDQPGAYEAQPAFAEPPPETIAATETLMSKLLQVPKDEADEVHRAHGQS